MQGGPVPTVGSLTRAVAAHGLEGRLAFPGHPLTDDVWAALGVAVRHQQLSGLLCAAISAGRLVVSGAQAHEATSWHRKAMAQVLALDQLLVEASGQLTGMEIPHRVLKGSAHAHLLYPDPSLRPYADVDLLVPGERFSDAVEALGRIGARRIHPELRPGFDRRFGKGTTLRTANGRGVDLHRTFVNGPFAMTIAADRLFDRSEPFTVGGARLLALGREERFLHTCFSAAVSDAAPRLLSLRDVAQGTREPALDFDRVLRLATAWSARPVLAKALSQACAILQLADETAPARWSRNHRISRAEARVMGAYEGSASRWGRQALAAAGAVPGVGSKLSYLWAVLFPTRAALGERQRSRPSLWSSAAGVALRQARHAVSRAPRG